MGLDAPKLVVIVLAVTAGCLDEEAGTPPSVEVDVDYVFADAHNSTLRFHVRSIVDYELRNVTLDASLLAAGHNTSEEGWAYEPIRQRFPPDRRLGAGEEHSFTVNFTFLRPGFTRLTPPDFTRGLLLSPSVRVNFETNDTVESWLYDLPCFHLDGTPATDPTTCADSAYGGPRDRMPWRFPAG